MAAANAICNASRGSVTGAANEQPILLQAILLPGIRQAAEFPAKPHVAPMLPMGFNHRIRQL